MAIRDMQWLKVTGRVHYRPRGKDDSDGIDYGDYPEPVIVADSIKKIERTEGKISLLKRTKCFSSDKLYSPQ